jgi:hypothetical protein
MMVANRVFKDFVPNGLPNPLASENRPDGLFRSARDARQPLFRAGCLANVLR